MKYARIRLFFVVLAVGLLSVELHADTRLADAAARYESGDYASAFRQYVKLARDGNPFAQYRASYMNLVGEGTKANPVEAIAWAVVAAEHGHEDVKRYQNAVAAMVPAEQRKKAQSRIDYYVRRYGREDSGNSSVLARTSEGSCTGSRLAANCGQSSTGGGKWIAWGEDKSSDPAQRAHIDELNRAIIDQAHQLSGGLPGR